MFKAKKVFASIFLAASALTLFGSAAQAVTVYYKGSAVSWEHGRDWGVISYSRVQSGQYEHSATANTAFSGWKAPGVLADASQNIGWAPAYAYWNCRG